MNQRFRKAMEEAKQKYAAERPVSQKLHEEACRFLPGGDTRTATFFLPYPNFIKSGSGAYLYDMDGHRLLDFQNNYTSLIHGHGHQPTVEAVQKQISQGSAYAAPFEAQVRLAQLLTERFPGLELVRFTNSGTEANMHALRIARAFTGKTKIIKTEGGYHGTTDVFEASVDPNIKKAGTLDQIKVIPESRGVSANALKDVLVVPFNDIERTRIVIEEHYKETACLIIEPIMGSAGQITPTMEYLTFLRDITRRYDILLIFDEVVTGRLTLGGAQKFYGVTPDLTTLGKIIGGGTPVGAFGGKREIMELYDPREKKMYHSGTFNGNALTIAAGLAAMECYDQEAVDDINRLGRMFAEEIKSIYHRLGLNMKVSGEGSIYNILFTDKDVHNYRDVAASHEELNRLLYMLLLTKGVFNAERGMFCLSTVMEEADVRFALSQVESALAQMLPVIEEIGPELLV